MDVFARNLACEQRNRLVGSLLGYLEKEVYPSLPSVKRKEVRSKVLASVGVYHDFVLDCLGAVVESGSVNNEEVLRLLRALHAGQANLARVLNDG